MAARGETESVDPGDLMVMGAAVRATQMAGALAAILDIAVDYAQERKAFGRAIAKFQAVQHNLARLAGETAAALAAAGSAADAIAHAEAFDEAVFLEVAAAKIRAGGAAGVGAASSGGTGDDDGFVSPSSRPKIMRPALVWSELVTVSVTVSPTRLAAASITTIVPSGR